MCLHYFAEAAKISDFYHIPHAYKLSGGGSHAYYKRPFIGAAGGVDFAGFDDHTAEPLVHRLQLQ